MIFYFNYCILKQTNLNNLLFQLKFIQSLLQIFYFLYQIINSTYIIHKININK